MNKIEKQSFEQSVKLMDYLLMIGWKVHNTGSIDFKSTGGYPYTVNWNVLMKDDLALRIEIGSKNIKSIIE